MDRNIVYPGAIPLDTDVLTVQRSTMAALGYLAQATLGTGTVVDGLACTQTTVASLSFNIGPGSILALSTVDATAFGSLSSDNTDPLVKMGINIGTTQFTTTAPVVGGQSINYLVQAAFQESDATSVVLPYYNSSNPAVPYSGPANAGTAQNTQRLQRVNLQMKTGTSAATGSQVTPTPDGGFVGLWVVTVAFGQTTVIAGNIAQYATAPFIPFKVPSLTPGFSRIQVFTSSGSFTWPSGVTKVKATVVGSGGAAGSTGATAAQGAAGGSAGGCAIKICTATPGTVTTVTVGGAGASSGPGAAGSSGATSSFGAFCSATGGTGGAASTTGVAPGGAVGAGSGGDINFNGGAGGDGQTSGNGFGGMGGNSIFGGAGRCGTASNSGTMQGQTYGAGGGGAYNVANASGGQGFAGVVIVEY